MTPLTGASAMSNGTSDAVIVCGGAFDMDPDLYAKPGFLCEVDPDTVVVNDVEYPILGYLLQVRLGKGKVVQTKQFEFGLAPPPAFISAKKLQAGQKYQVDYVATLDTGEKVTVENDDFDLTVPEKPGTVKPRVSFGPLKSGVGRGYTIKWAKTRRTEGYRVQVRSGSKWRTITALGNGRRAEYGAPKKQAGKFRVRAWNAGGYGKWAKA